MAHMFRPAEGKRQERKQGRHYHALKRLAIRDRGLTSWALPSCLTVRSTSTRHRGGPRRGFVYLIGWQSLVGGSRNVLVLGRRPGPRRAHLRAVPTWWPPRQTSSCSATAVTRSVPERCATDRTEGPWRQGAEVPGQRPVAGLCPRLLPVLLERPERGGCFLGCSWTDAMPRASRAWCGGRGGRGHGSRTGSGAGRLQPGGLCGPAAGDASATAVIARAASANGTGADPPLPPLAFVKDSTSWPDEWAGPLRHRTRISSTTVPTSTASVSGSSSAPARPSEGGRRSEARAAPQASVTQRVTVPGTECPSCKSREIAPIARVSRSSA